MISKEVLNQLSELMAMAIQIKAADKGAVDVKFISCVNGVEVTVHNETLGIKWSGICYLDWPNDDEEHGVNVMFPKFKEQMEKILLMEVA